MPPLHTDLRGGGAMVSPRFFYQLALIARVWLFVMLLYIWPSARVRRPPPAAPLVPRRQPTTEPKPFAGLTPTPSGALCAPASAVLQASPPLRPAPMPPPHRQPRTVDTAAPCGPHPGGDYRGWLGLGKLRAKRPSPRWPVAAVPRSRLRRLCSRDPWHAVAWPT
jgi:hypothetical protein